MFLKLIRCLVSSDNDFAFSHAQEGWLDTQHAPGFMGQWGGWEHGQPRHAWILSFWENEEDLHRFMALAHDRIQDKNGQASTYTGITVQHAHLVGTETSTLSEIHQKLSSRTSSCILHFTTLPLETRSEETYHFIIPALQTPNLYIELTDDPINEPKLHSSRIAIKCVDTWHIPSVSASRSSRSST